MRLKAKRGSEQCILKHEVWPPTPSTNSSRLFGGWHMKRLMPDC